MKKLVRIVQPEDVTERFILDFNFIAVDRQIIKLLYEMRILSTRNIARILNKKDSYVQNELAKLYKNGFIYRAVLTPEQGASEKEKSYWMLDRGGAMFIAGAYQISMKKLNWDIRKNMIRYEKMAHSIKIGECYAALCEAARENGDMVEQGLCDMHLRYDFTAEEKKQVICPDLFVVYRTKQSRYKYFFEIDTGTMPMTGAKGRTNVVVNKIPKYEDFRRSNEFKMYFDSAPRVVFVTNNTGRAKALLERIKESRRSNMEFLMGEIEEFKENPLGNIFASTNKEEKTSLFK